MISAPNPQMPSSQAQIALALRAGLGSVFIIGGVAKLERLLTPEKANGIVEQYVGPLGYINQTFLDWLFASPLGNVLTPWNFLTALSAFELLSGLMLVVGLMVRPLALLWALLLWSFVVSLPVVTTPGFKPPAATYMSPAEFVQIRDIALSGFFFALYNLGPGALGLDSNRYGLPPSLGRDWAPLGLLLRMSLGAVFLIGGFFSGFSKIATFDMPAVLLVMIGLGLVGGVGTRLFAAAAAAILLWFMATKLSGATTVIGYLNAVKREFAMLAVSGALAAVGGGNLFAIDRTFAAFGCWWSVYLGNGRSRAAAGMMARPR